MSVPMSVMNVFIGPYFRIKDSNIALATVFAFLFGMVWLLSILSCHIWEWLHICTLPFSDFGSGPIVSTTLSYACSSVSFIVIGVLICVIIFVFGTMEFFCVLFYVLRHIFQKYNNIFAPWPRFLKCQYVLLIMLCRRYSFFFYFGHRAE